MFKLNLAEKEMVEKDTLILTEKIKFVQNNFCLFFVLSE